MLFSVFLNFFFARHFHPVTIWLTARATVVAEREISGKTLILVLHQPRERRRTEEEENLNPRIKVNMNGLREESLNFVSIFKTINQFFF